MDELQEMREQMAALKEKLNKQEIITEDNWRKLVNQKIHRWKVNVILSFLAYPALILLSYYSDSGTIFGPIAWAIVGFAVIFSSIQSMLLLKKQDIMSGNLKDVLPRLHQIRKRERGSLSHLLVLAIPIIFFGDGFSELYQTGRPFGKMHLLFIAVGLAFTALYWLYYKFITLKQPSQWDEYIRQLKELSELDEEKEDNQK